MYVDIQLDTGGFILGLMVDERETAMSVRFLEKNTVTDLFSFKTPVWISKSNIITTYPPTYSLEKLGFERIRENVYKEIEPSSDEDYIPEEDEEEEEEEERLN